MSTSQSSAQEQDSREVVVGSINLLKQTPGTVVTLTTKSGSHYYITITHHVKESALKGWTRGLAVTTDSKQVKLPVAHPRQFIGEFEIKVGQDWRCSGSNTSKVTRITVG